MKSANKVFMIHIMLLHGIARNKSVLDQSKLAHQYKDDHTHTHIYSCVATLMIINSKSYDQTKNRTNICFLVQ